MRAPSFILISATSERLRVMVPDEKENQAFGTFVCSKVEQAKSDKGEIELPNVREALSEGLGSKCSTIFSRNSKCGDRLPEPFIKRWPKVVSDPLTELMEQLPSTTCWHRSHTMTHAPTDKEITADRN